MTPSSSLISWNFFFPLVLGLCLLLSLLSEPDLQTALKWFSLPHFPHFLLNAGQLPLLWVFPQYLQLWIELDDLPWPLLLLLNFPQSLKLLVWTESYEIAALIPNSFLCSILDSTFLASNKHFSGVSSVTISPNRWSWISFMHKPKMYWSFKSSSCTISGYLHSTMAKRSSDMYESQDWDCFCFSPPKLKSA